jgi:DNA-binding CsgD family transcriptional regulator
MTKEKTMSRTPQEARAILKRQYGARTYMVISLLARGYSTVATSRRTNVDLDSVRTYKGNMTRGHYDWILNDCAFVPRFTRKARQVIGMIRAGKDSYTIARTTGTTLSSVATYRGNYTRGCYAEMF